MKKAYTVFCQDSNGKGTIWIDAITAECLDSAIEQGRTACAEDWECTPDKVHCLGVAKGAVEILYWNDLGD